MAKLHQQLIRGLLLISFLMMALNMMNFLLFQERTLKTTKIQQIPVQVVNLERRIANWRALEPTLNALLSSHQFHPITRRQAVDGSQLDFIEIYENGKLSAQAYNSVLNHRRVNGVFMTVGGLGCSMSHIAIWDYAVRKNTSVLVLEDDIKLKRKAGSILERTIAKLPKNWGILYLADMAKTTRKYPMEINETDLVWEISKKAKMWGTYAYILSARAAKALMSNAYPIIHQTDTYIQRIVKRRRLRIFRMRKNLVTTNNAPNRVSDVQMFHVQKSPPLDRVFSNTIHVLDTEFSDEAKLFSNVNATYGPKSVKRWTLSEFEQKFQMDAQDQTQLVCMQLALLVDTGGVIFSNQGRYQKWMKSPALEKIKKHVLHDFIWIGDGLVAYEGYQYPIMAAKPRAPWVRQAHDQCVSLKNAKNRDSQLQAWFRKNLSHGQNLNGTALLVPVRVMVL